MHNAVKYLGYFFALSYLLVLAYVAVTSQSLYQGQWHLQYAAASLGLAFLVKFVQSSSVLALMFATMLLPLVKMVLMPSEQAFTTNAVGTFNLLFLISYVLVIYQIAKLKKQSRQQKSDQ
jgi:hypothetical protein